MRTTERRARMLTGAIGIVLTSALVVFGVRVANGALRSRYQVEASFDSAGQGLISGSDVKVHGVNIGTVRSVRLVDGVARVRMDIDADERIPVASMATIRPKTLFGEKFVDIDPGGTEAQGPFLEDEGEIADTLGGFELERVLSSAYPVLKAIDPAKLTVILDELARGAAGQGPAINRQLGNFATLADLQARHNADTERFLDDLATLSEVLGDRADELVEAAVDLNDVLPELNSRGAALTTVLDQAGRLAGDVADVLEANRPFLEHSIVNGGRTIQRLYDDREQLPGLVVGLRQFLQTLAEVGSYRDFGDGTNLAAIKFIIGEDSPCGRTAEGCPLFTGAAKGARATAAPEPPRSPLGLPVPETGTAAVRRLLSALLGVD